MGVGYFILFLQNNILFNNGKCNTLAIVLTFSLQVRIKIKLVTVVRDRGHTRQWWRRVVLNFSSRFPTHYPTTTEFICSGSIARGGLPIDRTKHIDYQTRPNLELHSFLRPSSFRLANPFPRHLYPYSFKATPQTGHDSRFSSHRGTSIIH